MYVLNAQWIIYLLYSTYVDHEVRTLSNYNVTYGTNIIATLLYPLTVPCYSGSRDFWRCGTASCFIENLIGPNGVRAAVDARLCNKIKWYLVLLDGPTRSNSGFNPYDIEIDLLKLSTVKSRGDDNQYSTKYLTRQLNK